MPGQRNLEPAIWAPGGRRRIPAEWTDLATDNVTFYGIIKDSRSRR